MESLSSLAGRELHWKVDMGLAIPTESERHWVLFDGDVAVVSAQAMWQRLDHFDMVMECGEGTYQAHVAIDTPGTRPAVAWKLGQNASMAGFALESEGAIAVKGWIDTASGRRLAMEATHSFTDEYVLFQPGGPRLLTVAPAAGVSIGSTAGKLLIAPEAAGDPELPALVVLCFAVASEQVMLLHTEPQHGWSGVRP